jgi:hypothetical protein
MHPGAGGGWLAPEVANTSTARAMNVTAAPATTTLRSRLVSRRKGVLTRL